MGEKSLLRKLLERSRNQTKPGDRLTATQPTETELVESRLEVLRKSLEAKGYSLAEIQDKTLGHGFFTTDPEVAEYSAEFAKVSRRPVVMIELGSNSDAQALSQELDHITPGTTIIVKIDAALEETVTTQGTRRTTTQYTDRSVGTQISHCSNVVRAQQTRGNDSTVILLPNENSNTDTVELIMNLTPISPRAV